MAKEHCNNYDKNCDINLLRKENKTCVKNNFTNEYILKNNIIKISSDPQCFDISDLNNLVKFNNIKLTNDEQTYLNTVNK